MRLTWFAFVAFVACAPPGYTAAPAAPAEQPQCNGGAVPSGDQCVCPDGTSWDGQQCAGAQAQALACSGGAVPSGDQCVCPDGTSWDGQQCVGAAPPEQPPEQPYQPPPSIPTSGPDVQVTYEVHRATDEIGKSCTSDTPSYPAAGTCQYGAVCFRRVCTVWCGNDRSCPSGMQCAMTGAPENTELCQR
jgi:hypothetical protein